MSNWKATEYRFFLLHIGPTVLKGLLKEEVYLHFLLLHIAGRILSNRDMLKKYGETAKQYLVTFVEI